MMKSVSIGLDVSTSFSGIAFVDYETGKVIAADLVDTRHMTSLEAASMICDRIAMLLWNIGDSEDEYIHSIG
jgi:hypothetical protein